MNCKYLFCSIYRMAGSNIDIELETFITTLFTCHSAVYLDAIPMRKQTLKEYLLSAAVPITTICKALDFNDSAKIQEDEPVEEVCQLFFTMFRKAIHPKTIFCSYYCLILNFETVILQIFISI